MSQDAEWVEWVMADWAWAPIPELCEQFGCNEPVQTWCDRCRAYFCDDHEQCKRCSADRMRTKYRSKA